MPDTFDLTHLLSQIESEWLDFKQEHHANALDLLHDVLCLSNSWAEHDRHLVFGVTDDRKVLGVELDANRRTSAAINDLLRQSNLNRLPALVMRTLDVGGHEIDVLTIMNQPGKPFFATKDKRLGKDVLRAGVVYTRVGDTNVPLSESARDEQIEQMWRERFGVGKPPLTRMFDLIRARDRWESVGGDSYRYHRDFPEFTIRDGEVTREPFSEAWTDRFPDPTAASYEVQLRYSETILRTYTFVSCDGGRYRLPLPTLNDDRFVINTNAPPWHIAHLYQQYSPPEEAFHRVGVELLAGERD